MSKETKDLLVTLAVMSERFSKLEVRQLQEKSAIFADFLVLEEAFKQLAINAGVSEDNIGGPAPGPGAEARGVALAIKYPDNGGRIRPLIDKAYEEYERKAAVDWQQQTALLFVEIQAQLQSIHAKKAQHDEVVAREALRVAAEQQVEDADLGPALAASMAAYEQSVAPQEEADMELAAALGMSLAMAPKQLPDANAGEAEVQRLLQETKRAYEQNVTPAEKAEIDLVVTIQESLKINPAHPRADVGHGAAAAAWGGGARNAGSDDFANVEQQMLHAALAASARAQASAPSAEMIRARNVDHGGAAGGQYVAPKNDRALEIVKAQSRIEAIAKDYALTNDDSVCFNNLLEFQPLITAEDVVLPMGLTSFGPALGLSHAIILD